MSWREAYTWAWDDRQPMEWRMWEPGGETWTRGDIAEIATRLNAMHAELQMQVQDVDRLEEANRELSRLAYRDY